MSDEKKVEMDLSVLGADDWLVVITMPKDFDLDNDTCEVLAKRIKKANPCAEIVFLPYGMKIDGFADDALAYLGLVRQDTHDKTNEYTLRSSVFKMLEAMGDLRRFAGIPNEVIDAMLGSQADVCEYVDRLVDPVESWCSSVEENAMTPLGQTMDTGEVRDLLKEVQMLRGHIESGRMISA